MLGMLNLYKKTDSRCRSSSSSTKMHRQKPSHQELVRQAEAYALVQGGAQLTLMSLFWGFSNKVQLHKQTAPQTVL